MHMRVFYTFLFHDFITLLPMPA